MLSKISQKRLLLMLADMGAINAAFAAALLLRFDAQVPSQWLYLYGFSFWVYSLLSLLSFSWHRFYDYEWRYVTIRNIFRFAAGVLAGVLGYVIALYFIDQASFPRTVMVMQVILGTMAVSGIRLSINLAHHFKNGSVGKATRRVLVAGAGDAGESLLRDIHRRKEVLYHPVGFLDDNPKKTGMLVRGVPVLGKIADVRRVVAQKRVSMVIIAMPTASREQLRRIVSQCEEAGVEVKRVPSLFDILDGKVTLSEIREVEPEDILGRELNLWKEEGLAGYLSGKRVLVTGAGGSIGAELCRQIMGYGPRQLVLIDSSEYNLYAVDAELQEAYGPGRHAAVLANIQSQKTMDGIFAAYRPEIVFHAAAYKHVPLMEENAPEAVKNNIWGTQNVAVLAAKHQAERFVLISTDKAVNPVNLMGASKRVAEMVVQSMTGRSQTVFSSVRFGNVLDSRGSVLPLFKKQIAQGGPVTVTHPEVVRYFMTIPEAVQLVLTAGAMARGGETFVLEMGKPVKILDMAKSLIRLSGLVPYKDIDIKIIGLRPGEKLYEELLTAGKGIQETLSERIFVDALEARDHESLFESVEALWQLANANDVQGILTRLQELVPEFHPKALAVSAASGPEDLLAL